MRLDNTHPIPLQLPHRNPRIDNIDGDLRPFILIPSEGCDIGDDVSVGFKDFGIGKIDERSDQIAVEFGRVDFERRIG
jgi:hypothetical protein